MFVSWGNGEGPAVMLVWLLFWVGDGGGASARPAGDAVPFVRAAVAATFGCECSRAAAGTDGEAAATIVVIAALVVVLVVALRASTAGGRVTLVCAVIADGVAVTIDVVVVVTSDEDDC